MIKFNYAKSRGTKQSDAYSSPTSLDSYEYSKSDQAKYIALVFVSSVGLITARLLQPSLHGVGTHEQLGLPPCAFLHFTGIPCPSCGLTTSFAHAARLHFYEAFITQPFGFIIFCLTALSIPLSFYLIYSRSPWAKLIYSAKSNHMLYALIALYLLSWLYKIAAMNLLIPHS
ncbi:MAG: DUF2752 domain-containing protein [Blastocatellales bacterium]